MATIIRNLVITSLEQLYKLLKNREELTEKHSQFSFFIEITRDYLKGCQCFEDVLYHLSIREYNKISDSEELINIIKNHFNCDSVKIIKIN